MAQVRDFKSTETGGWAVESGDFVTVADAEAVPQGIRIRCGMFLSECFLDESIGVDYIDKVLVKNPDPLVIRAEFTRAISGTPDVTNVIGAQLVDEGDRDASISYAVDTIYSQDPITGQIGTP